MNESAFNSKSPTMATLIGCQYYYLLFLLWLISSVTFFLDIHTNHLRKQMSTSLAQCWDQFNPIVIIPLVSLCANLPTTQIIALASHS
ncbi:hypothetical protein HN51_038973 [Arachis hypogaea]|uniref:Uncharacterized protein n=1 Tax=Arachis hypogaea TaxID=3818 RepID=A0A444YHB7_ARAHY|nr:uncharacterized protein DS421_16g528580 [Arachis hypogaea]RYR01316.1 hypothetical protein Ahy_B06g080180 [Arachis hypogaea]